MKSIDDQVFKLKVLFWKRFFGKESLCFFQFLEHCKGDPQLELEAKNEDNIIERNASTKVEENDDEETETEIQDKLKEPPAVSARSTTCSSKNAIIKPFKKSYSVEATSTTGMW